MTETQRITSSRNPRVVSARKLLRRVDRARTGSFLVEGLHVVGAALEAKLVEELFYDDTAPGTAEVAARAVEEGAVVHSVAGHVVEALSAASTPQGAVAVARDPLVDVASLGSPTLIAVLADVRDPGNVGTLLRSSLAAGAAAVVTAGSSDPLGPKAVRAAAGALFARRVARASDLEDALGALRDTGMTILGADAHSEWSLYDVDLTKPVAVVLGNEAWGIPDSLGARLDGTVGIPMPGPAESLNVAVAGSILLFEAVRQRRGRLSSAF